MVISVDGRQLPQLCLDINSEQGPSVRDGARVSDNRDGSTLILRFGFSRTDHLDNDISHAMIVVNHIDDNLINLALGDKVARIMRCPL